MAVYRPTEQTALYRFYDKNSDLLYVGVSLNIPARMCQHSKTTWSHLIRRVDVAQLETGPKALAAERRAIWEEKPRFNKRSKRSTSYKPKVFENWMNNHEFQSIWAAIIDWREADRYSVGWLDLTENDICGITSEGTSTVRRYLKWLNKNGIISGYLEGSGLGFMLEQPEFELWEEVSFH